MSPRHIHPALLLLLLIGAHAEARLIQADPSNYRSFLSTLRAGDTLSLAAGTYTQDLALSGLNGTADAPIVITGSPVRYTTVFLARACCNTVSITQCSYLVIRNLELNGNGVEVDAVKGEGTAGNWAHHITLEYLNIVGYGGDQQLVGISTKCHAWDWVIRRNRIIGAGTGLYLGNSDGDKPFVNGLIEYNLILNPVGYCMQIKHQAAGVRDVFPGTAVDGKTIVRHNVFCKQQNASTGANARPNVLLGAFPPDGPGARDTYEVYGNFFYDNPVEALLQVTGNTNLYANVFVNHQDPAGFPTVSVTAQNGFRPRTIHIFHNTILSASTTGGIRLYNPDPAYTRTCIANAVFTAHGIEPNFPDTLANVLDAYRRAGLFLVGVSSDIARLDLVPFCTRLRGDALPDSLFPDATDGDRDFNGLPYDATYRGAYACCDVNPGWKLALDTMAEKRGGTTFSEVVESRGLALELVCQPQPIRHAAAITGILPSEGRICISLVDQLGREVTVIHDAWHGAGRFSTTAHLASISAGVYFLRAVTGNAIVAIPLIIAR
ncbi:MAG: hypothetical protein HY962_10295 [Ignavibacteriae bacterium]|nr:hypothetical protein [Ignavibacteriota bacterium]